MPSLHYALIGENERFKLLATFLETNKTHRVLVLFSTQPQIQFFESVFSNLLPRVPLNFGLLDAQNDVQSYDQVVLADVPSKFETLSKIVDQLGAESKLILLIFKANRGYVKMVGKKLSLTFSELSFNPHKFLMIEEKYLELIDSNYAINRQAFYAYGSFLQYFNSHLLKRIFRTDRLNMKNVGIGFGMPVPPKVNLEAKFLTQKAQLKEKTIKKKQKLERVKERTRQQKQVQEKKEDEALREEVEQIQQPLHKRNQKNKAFKTKRIQKEKRTAKN